MQLALAGSGQIGKRGLQKALASLLQTLGRCIPGAQWLTSRPAGEVAEWLKAHAWNACKG